MLARQSAAHLLRRPAVRPSVASLRFFSDDTHSDFAPQRKAPEAADPNDVQALIKEHVESHKILLYMKGTPAQPQCGFSMQVVRILHASGVDFDAINVLQYPEIREGIKEYS